MMHSFCPRCNSSNIEEIADGYYRCLSCGYEGVLGIEKGIFRK